MATLIKGKEISVSIREQLKAEVAKLTAEVGAPMGLAVIIVGEDPASKVYVANKVKASLELGIRSYHIEMPADVDIDTLIGKIRELNKNPDVNGILVQLPLPKHLDEKAVLNAIDVTKDVDGFSPYQMGKLVIGEPELIACTPSGVMAMLDYHKIPIAGKHAVIIGRSNIVGKPMAYLLLQRHATVTICHSKTQNLTEYTKKADILVAAVGKAEMLKGDMVKQKAVVIDVGINRTESGLKGDVDFAEVEPIASYITPVPGGVGPMTITMLMANTVKAYRMQHGR